MTGKLSIKQQASARAWLRGKVVEIFDTVDWLAVDKMEALLMEIIETTIEVREKAKP